MSYTPAPPPGGFSLSGCDPAAGSFFPLGDTTVTCSYLRLPLVGSRTRTFVIRVVDMQPPQVWQADVEQATDPNQAGAIVNYTSPPCLDNASLCSVTCSPASGGFFPIGETAVTCTATDGSGNTATTEFG